MPCLNPGQWLCYLAAIFSRFAVWVGVKGSHPEGAEKSALEHLIGEQKTITSDQGMLLPLTRRMHSNVCRFTSEFSMKVSSTRILSLNHKG